MSSPTLGILIRFSDSAATLPAVLAALRRQTLQPGVILGINSGGTDASSALIRAAGGWVVNWTRPYAHSAVLNFGLNLLGTDLVLVLSSHTVLDSPDTLAQMVAALLDPAVACASLKWDDDPFYSDTLSWTELQHKGLRFGSFYSNSMGMLRRSLWESLPFDETLPTAEDYTWALAQLQNGHLCRRLHLPFSYRRGGTARDAEFAQLTFRFARHYGLRVAWLGPTGSIKHLAHARLRRLLQHHAPAEASSIQAVRDRLNAWWQAQRLRPTLITTKPSTPLCPFPS
jgi:glycosyltransferase involved in cell wall biosynthesis